MNTVRAIRRIGGQTYLYRISEKNQLQATSLALWLAEVNAANHLLRPKAVR